MKRNRDTFADHYESSSSKSRAPASSEDDLRNEVRADDPMAALLRKKDPDQPEKSSSDSTKPAPTIPTYRGHYPPNRYNIRPGYRWDGVDRSNGFERRLLDREAAKKASEEDSYRRATMDL